MTKGQHASDLSDLEVGDRVVLKRNLTHPAWCDATENEYGDIIRTTKPDLAEYIGTTEVTECYDLPALFEPGDWGYIPAKHHVRTNNHLWYERETGDQVGTGATRIERI